MPSERGGHICGIDKAGDTTWADRCSAFLKKKGVIVASRFGKLRVAPHLYNTEEEIEKLCTLLTMFERTEAQSRL